jgi:alpha-D-ribose 1-methylphosphonate 5-triphosphate synthase subunit PhnH
MAVALARGFSQPVFECQQVFRAMMDALARPSTVVSLHSALAPPAPLTAELAAVALTLADADAPLWLDAALAASPAVSAYLRFHTGAPIVTAPADAAFALVRDLAECPALDHFALGSPEYPDLSTTLILAVSELSDESGLALAGPGIPDRASLHVASLPPRFAEQARANHRFFPRGIDLLFVAPGRIVGLPRSTCLLED